MMEKKINEYLFDNFPDRIDDLFQDMVAHPESECREEETLLLVNLVYFEGFKDGLKFMEWLNNNCSGDMKMLIKVITDCVMGKRNING